MKKRKEMKKLKELLKKHHKLSALCMTLAVCAVIGTIGTTYAWLTDRDDRGNYLRLADVEGAVNAAASANMTQGAALSQNVSVTNTGSSPAFVRVLVSPELVEGGLSVEIEIGNQLSVNLNTADWEYCKNDGYYYYIKDKLAPGETSTNLFTSVTLNEAMYKGLTWEFEFKAEFVGITSHAYRTAWWQDRTLTAPDDNALINVDSALTSKVQP